MLRTGAWRPITASLTVQPSAPQFRDALHNSEMTMMTIATTLRTSDLSNHTSWKGKRWHNGNLNCHIFHLLPRNGDDDPASWTRLHRRWALVNSRICGIAHSKCHCNRMQSPPAIIHRSKWYVCHPITRPSLKIGIGKVKGGQLFCYMVSIMFWKIIFPHQ